MELDLFRIGGSLNKEAPVLIYTAVVVDGNMEFDSWRHAENRRELPRNWCDCRSETAANRTVDSWPDTNRQDTGALTLKGEVERVCKPEV